MRLTFPSPLQALLLQGTRHPRNAPPVVRASDANNRHPKQQKRAISERQLTLKETQTEKFPSEVLFILNTKFLGVKKKCVASFKIQWQRQAWGIGWARLTKSSRGKEHLVYIILAKDLFVFLIPPALFFPVWNKRHEICRFSNYSKTAATLHQDKSPSQFGLKNQNQSPEVYQQPRRLSSYNFDHQMWAQGLRGIKSQHPIIAYWIPTCSGQI